MTLLMYNGFEGYSTPADQENVGDGVNFISVSDWSYTTGRNGGKAVKNHGGTWDRVVDILLPGITNDKIAILGFAFYMTSSFGNSELAFLGDGYSGDGGYIDVGSNGDLIARAKNFGTAASAKMSISLNQWYYVEMKVRLHNTIGYFNVRINEQELIDWTGDFWFSGSDLTVDRCYIKAFKSNRSLIDDVYIADDQGTEVNDYLGDIRIDSIRPNEAGNYVQMTPSAGNNYECVDEDELDESDYVEGANAGEKDSYTYGSVPTDLDDIGIIALQIKNNAKRTATADNIKIDNFIRTGSTDYSQTALSLSDDFTMVDGDMILKDPSDSGDWTQAKINACEFGMEVA